jgi:hypothetical protein
MLLRRLREREKGNWSPSCVIVKGAIRDDTKHDDISREKDPGLAIPPHAMRNHILGTCEIHAGVLNDTFVAVRAHNGTDAHHHKHRTG